MIYLAYERGVVMMAMSQITIRLDEQEKKKFEKNAEAIGLTTSTAIKMFIAKFNLDKGFSYPITSQNEDEIVRLPPEIERAMVITKAEELGLLDESSEPVHDIQELRKKWMG